MENANSTGVKSRRDRQLSDGENCHQNYAIAAVYVRHSHSIVPGGLLVTS